MTKVPSAVWIVDTKKEHIAVGEAHKLGVPVIAILDTNCDPDEVDYKIPGNDDAIRSAALLTRVIADAVADGLMARAAGQANAGRVGRRRPGCGRRAAARVGDASCSQPAGAQETDIRAADGGRGARPVRPTRLPRARSPRPPRTPTPVPPAGDPGPGAGLIHLPRSGPTPPTADSTATTRFDRQLGDSTSAGHRPAGRHSEPTEDRDGTEMANYAATDVKKLRDATGAGMMDAKKALDETDGDFDAAIEVLRVKGAAKVAKRAGDREAANGLVAAAENAMILLACETDFVAKGEDLQTLAGNIVAHLAGSASTRPRPASADPAAFAEKLRGETLADGRTVQENIDALAAIIGEKLVLAKAVKLSGTVATYLHRKSSDLPAQVGVLVQFAGEGEKAYEAARAAAMQVAAMRPAYLQREDVPAETVETEKRVAEAKAREDGKPEQAMRKIIEGSVNGYYKNNVLLEQASVQDRKKSVKALLDDAGVLVTGFAHFEVG